MSEEANWSGPTPPQNRIRVLHVTESFGGGTQSAILHYAAATNQYRHMAVVRERRDSETAQATAALSPLVKASGSLHAFVLQVRRQIVELEPDIIHLHSSKAGLLRFAIQSKARVVYTPHCYAFERTDLSSMTRNALRTVERVLGQRRQLVIAVGSREAELTRQLHTRGVLTVPNAAPALPERGLRARPVDRVQVVTCGRVAAQKDPRFLAEIALLASRRFSFCWLGGGDAGLEDLLRSAGVEVTGWLPRVEVLARMRDADLYLHTAAWESNPFTLLEAAALGLPVVARQTPSTSALGFSTLGKTPESVVQGLDELVQHQRSWQETHDLTDRVLLASSPERQARSLVRAYDAALQLL